MKISYLRLASDIKYLNDFISSCCQTLKKIKYITYILLFFTIISYSQTEKKLIEDNCNCVKNIEETITQEQKKKSTMDCSLNAFNKNRFYTEKVVKEFTGKNSITGQDVFKYLQDVFDYKMTNNCEEYKDLMSEILGAKSINSTVKEIGLKVCTELNEKYSIELANSTIERLTKEKKEEIIKEYGEIIKNNIKEN